MDKKDKFEDLLLEFVERATKKEATTAELAILPAVAKILITLLLYPGENLWRFLALLNISPETFHQLIRQLLCLNYSVNFWKALQ